MHSLPLFVRLQGRSVIVLGEGEPAAAKRSLLERAGALIVDEDANAALAIVAINDDGAAEAAADRLKARGILVNAVDRPALCDFTLPAIVDRDPVLIAIGTGGASAGLAKALRQRLEVMLPASLGALATKLKEGRARMRARWPEGNTRRHAIDAALEPGGALDPFGAGSANQFDTWIDTGFEGPVGAFHRIALRSDDPDDLTLRQARLLAQADRVLYGSGVAPDILSRARADATRRACDALPSGPFDGITIYLERI